MTKNTTGKNAILYTSLASVLTASATQAAMVLSPTVGGGIMPSAADGFTPWDVDNDGTVDFHLRHHTYYDSLSSSTLTYALLDDQNGGRLLVKSSVSEDGIAKLNPGFVVGPVMTGYKFHASAQSYNTLTSSGVLGRDATESWSPPLPTSGYFGFKFTNAGGTHYGWGIIDFTGSPVGQGFTILEAWYETDVDTAITVPETETAALGLAGLALGAAGLRSWRKRKAA